jgi:hypothetical protein
MAGPHLGLLAQAPSRPAKVPRPDGTLARAVPVPCQRRRRGVAAAPSRRHTVERKGGTSEVAHGEEHVMRVVATGKRTGWRAVGARERRGNRASPALLGMEAMPQWRL